MPAKLIGDGGPLAGRVFSLEAPVVRIGRRDENDIVIKDPTVSRRHAEIRREGDDLVLVDNGSTSGTLVNGAPIEGAYRLRDGDSVVIGNSVTFAVQIDADDRADDDATIAFSRERLAPPHPTIASQPSVDTAAAAAPHREVERPKFMPRLDERPEVAAPSFLNPPPAGSRAVGPPAPVSPAGDPDHPAMSASPPAFQEPAHASDWSAAPPGVAYSSSNPAAPPPLDATSEFGAPPAPANQPPSFAAAPAPADQPPSFAAPPPSVSSAAPPASPAVAAAGGAVPATRGSRRGLVIGLTAALLLVLAVCVVIALVLYSR